MLAILISVAAMFALNVATPGASFILTLRNSLSFGPKIGRCVALGLSLADAFYAVLALSGVAAVLRLHSGLAASVGAVGGMWLGSLGLALLYARRAQVRGEELSAELAPSPGQALRSGCAAGLVNPQSILFLSTVILASDSVAPDLLQATLIAATIATTSVLVRCGIATVVSVPSVRAQYLARRRSLEAASGLALLGFGMRLSVKAMLPWAVKALSAIGIALHVI